MSILHRIVRCLLISGESYERHTCGLANANSVELAGLQRRCVVALTPRLTRHDVLKVRVVGSLVGGFPRVRRGVNKSRLFRVECGRRHLGLCVEEHSELVVGAHIGLWQCVCLVRQSR